MNTFAGNLHEVVLKITIITFMYTYYIEGYMLCINLSYFMSTLLLISGIRSIIEKKKKKAACGRSY